MKATATMQGADLLVWNLCADAKDAFERLADAAERVATREAGEGVENLVPADIAPLAEKAAAYAAGNPYISIFHHPDPLARLAGMVERVRALETTPARKDAAEIAMECAVLAAFAAMRVERLIERRHCQARLLTAQADAAAARGDFEEAKRWRKEVKDIKKGVKEILTRVEGVPAMVQAAGLAWKRPFEMGAELEKKMAVELSENARRLWYAYREQGSINKAYGKAGLSYGTAHRLWKGEIVPFLARNGIPDPVAITKNSGKVQTVSLDRMGGWGKEP